MQEFLKEVIVTFGDLLASLGFIVIGLLARRLWLVIILALVWACVAYGVRLQDQLGIPFAELPDQIDWAVLQAEMPLRFGIAVVISFAAWVCMGLIIGSFAPRRKRAGPAQRDGQDEAEQSRAPRGRQERREPAVGGGQPGGRMEPSLGRAAPDDGIPPLPVGLRQPQAQQSGADAFAPEAAPEPDRPMANLDVVLPRDPQAAAAALRRLYGEEEIDEILARLAPRREPGSST